MASAIEFYFDFSSPYSYIASEQIEALAARTARALQWRPILLGAVFKSSGGAPLTEVYRPKARYSVRDFARSAAFVGVPYRHPTTFPIGAVAASRAVLWLQREQSPQAVPYIHAVFRAFFVDDRNVGDATVALDIAKSLGVEPARLAAGVQDEAIKNALRGRGRAGHRARRFRCARRSSSTARCSGAMTGSTRSSAGSPADRSRRGTTHDHCRLRYEHVRQLPQGKVGARHHRATVRVARSRHPARPGRARPSFCASIPTARSRSSCSTTARPSQSRTRSSGTSAKARGCCPMTGSAARRCCSGCSSSSTRTSRPSRWRASSGCS